MSVAATQAPKSLRIALVAGEASGDYLGAELIRALALRFPDAHFYGIAGPRMVEQGCAALYPMSALGVMGITEVLGKMLSILRLRRAFARELINNPPDCFIGIDYPDFNIGLAKKLRAHHITTIQYNSPKVWAWRKNRIHKIGKAVELMLCLLPFECDVYREHHLPVSFVGHPMADEIPLVTDTMAARKRLCINDVPGPVIALLPGSRGYEVQRLTPVFLQAAKLCLSQHLNATFITPMVNDERREQFEQIHQHVCPDLNVKLYMNAARDVISAADVVLLASGTATLETMLCKKPMVVAYRFSAVTYRIIKSLVTVKYMSLPNLLANNEIVPEFTQGEASPENLARAVLAWLADKPRQQKIINQFIALHQELHMDAGEKAVDAIVDLLIQKGILAHA